MRVWITLLVSTPGQMEGGQRTKALVQFVDITPTLIEMCGLPVPDGPEGRSLVPLITDPDRPWNEVARSQFPRPVRPVSYNFTKPDPQVMGYSIRTDRYRYTEWQTFATGTVQARELYDHDGDPGETVNLAETTDLKSTVSRLARTLAIGFQRIRDTPIPATDRHPNMQRR